MMPEVYRESEPYIFISYSHDDDTLVLPIIKKLHAYGYRVWYDQGIDPGTEWIETIALKIRSCGCFIALLSKNYLASKVCVKELHHALNLERKLLVVYLEDVELSDGLAMQINPVQHISKYTYKKEADFYSKLFSSPLLNVCLDKTDTQSQTPKESSETTETPKKTAKPSPAKGAQTETPVKKPTRQKKTTPEQGNQTTASGKNTTNKKKTASQQGKQAATPVNNGSSKTQSPPASKPWLLAGLSLFFSIASNRILATEQAPDFFIYSFIFAAIAGYLGIIGLHRAKNPFAAVLSTVGILLAFSPCTFLLKAGLQGLPITVLFYMPFVVATIDQWLWRYNHQPDTHHVISVVFLVVSVILLGIASTFLDAQTYPPTGWWLLAISAGCILLSNFVSEKMFVWVASIAVIGIFAIISIGTLIDYYNVGFFNDFTTLSFVAAIIPPLGVIFYRDRT